MLHRRIIIDETEYKIAVGQCGKGAPTEDTEGYVGVTYMDSETARMYKCISDSGGKYTWVPLDGDTQERIDVLARQVAELDAMNPLKFTSISCSPSSAETGDVVTAVTISWKFNKAPASVVVGGVAVEPVTSGSYTISGLNLSEKMSWTIKAEDAAGKEISSTVSLNFYPGIYYGVMADGWEINSTTVRAMMPNGPKIQSGRAVEFTATANAGQRLAYALPVNGYGTPAFKDKNTGFQAGFYLADTVSVTNRHGHTEDYNVWLSAHPGIGTVTVAVT